MTSNSMTPIERLRAGIWDIHQGVASPTARPDTGPTESVMKGNLPLYKYRASVGQRFLFLKGFEQILEAFRHLEPRVSYVVTEDHLHAAKCREDVIFLGDDPDLLRPLPSITAFLKWVTRTNEDHPLTVLAADYVLEGSNNGAVQIAKAVQKAYGFTGTDGVMHLLPYGSDQRTVWESYVQAFNENVYTEKELTNMVATARKTFDFMNAMTQEAYALPEPK